MFCSKCGAAVIEGAVACSACGATIVPPPPVITTPAATPAAYQQPPRQQPRYVGPQQTDGKAVGSLILGLLAIFPLGLLAGIPAVVLGHLSKSSIARSMGRLKGEGMATAGLVMGYLSVVVLPIILIIAAIAIPNLLRARIRANEAQAASTVVTLNTAQARYSMNYNKYAGSLSVLGPGHPPVTCSDLSQVSSEHACLIDSVLGCGDATGCIKGGYQYNVRGLCGDDATCTDYVATAVPLRHGTTGVQSFCSTSDQIIRVHEGGSVLRLPTIEECQAWPIVR